MNQQMVNALREFGLKPDCSD